MGTDLRTAPTAPASPIARWRLARPVVGALALVLVACTSTAPPEPAAPVDPPSSTAASQPEPGTGAVTLWVDQLDPDWFARRWQPGSAIHRSVTGPATSQGFERLDAVLRERQATRGLPQQFVAERGSLARFRDHRELLIRRYPPVPWEAPFDWHRPRPEVDETYFAELHSWRFMTQLLRAYRDNGDPELLAAVELAAEDWIRQNPYPRGAHRRAWHEGAVIKRTLVLINWLDTLAARPAPEAERFAPHQVLALLAQHVEYLLIPSTYTGIGNHGMRQDVVLIVASFALPDALLGHPARDAETWRQMALDRLETIQIGQGFTATGIWREHSPVYHRYVINILSLARDALVDNGAPVPERLNEIVGNWELYLAHVLTPAGRYPPVGDTLEQRMPLHLIETPELTYTASGGKRGTAPEELDGFFPLAGEAVLRSGWGSSPEEYARSFYLHLHAAQHLPMGHRHQDDLAFVAHHAGRWWVVDAGRYNYGRNPWREHVVTAWAHNGWILDGRPVGPTDQPHLDTGLDTQRTSTPEVGAVRAWSDRFPRRGARAERLVVLFRHRPQVLVVDRLRVPGGGHWEGLLHMAPELTVREASYGDVPLRFRASAPDADRLVLDLLLDATTTEAASVYRGTEGARAPEPGRGGWVSPGPRKITPTPTLSIERRGESVVAPMLLTWRQEDEPLTERLAVTEGVDGTLTVSWREGDERFEVDVAFEGEPFRASRRVPVAQSP